MIRNLSAAVDSGSTRQPIFQASPGIRWPRPACHALLHGWYQGLTAQSLKVDVREETIPLLEKSGERVLRGE